MSPAPEADRRTLLRRLTFDLTGLPPTPEDVTSFVADEEPDAYDRLVERLLASPAYGERWGRHWLDVVRFAESDGFETNLARPRAWPYRDFVIAAFNDDRPYDRFVADQVAGDVRGADAATGFLVAGAFDRVKSPDVALTRQQRADEVNDMIAVTSGTFLGLTVGCARCHNHKFDPISQVDYHAFKAIFAGVRHGERPVEPLQARCERLARVAELRRELAAAERDADDAQARAEPAKVAGRRPPVNARRNVESFAPATAKFVRFTVAATNNLEPCIDELEVFTPEPQRRNVALSSGGTIATASGTYRGSDRHKLEHVNDGRYGNGRSWISDETGRGWVQVELPEAVEIDRIVWGRDRDGNYSDRLPTKYRIEVGTEPGSWTVVATSDDRLPFGSTAPADPFAARVADLQHRLRESGPPTAYVGEFGDPEPVFRLHRGDPMQPRERVGPGGLTAVGPKLSLPADAADPERRVAFAAWLTDPANPLTARVMVNRLWHHHFGRGIVDTPSDFGRNGGRPTHPELLDWLASEFVDQEWSVKHIHRLIVRSATYRQASVAGGRGSDVDANVRLLWRFPSRRLEAEAIRDAVLAVSGCLDRRMGGPGFDLFQPNDNYVKVYTPKTTFGPAEWRRLVYQSRPRMRPDDTFGAFDCPDGGQIAPARTRSTTPLQALNLLNSPFMTQQADRFAQRLRREAGDNVEQRVRRAFQLAFGRLPSDDEFSAAARLTSAHGPAALCRALFNANEFLFVD